MHTLKLTICMLMKFLLDSASNCIENVTENWFAPDVKEDVLVQADENSELPYQEPSSQTSWSKLEIQKNYRKFNFDLAPKVTNSK